MAVRPYTHLVEALYEPPNRMSLMFLSTGTLALKGRNLDKMLIPLQDAQIQVMRVFSPARHRERPGEEETVITEIARVQSG